MSDYTYCLTQFQVLECINMSAFPLVTGYFTDCLIHKPPIFLKPEHFFLPFSA